MSKKHEIDLIKELGSLAFGSRLRRLSERLLRDASQIYEREDIRFEARWFPVFYLLWRQSPLAVTAIAQRLHLSHPAVNQVAGAMAKAGLLTSSRDAEDDRRRLLALSAEGKELAKKLQPIWRDIREATAEVLSLKGVDFLDAIARVEKSLDEMSVYDRVVAKMRARQLAEVQIVGYQPRYRESFESLNRAWIERYFELEPKDRAMLENPQEQIIDRGGEILFAKLRREVTGTVALIRHDAMTLELAKMAVDEKARGMQIGMKLALAAIERAKALNAHRIVLFTNAKLVAANALYSKLGFVPARSPHKFQPPYRRPSIMLELNLKKNAQKSQRRIKK